MQSSNSSGGPSSVDPSKIKIKAVPRCAEKESLGAAAQRWFAFGFRVIPIKPDTKITAVKWDPWLEDLSPETISNYWAKHPDHEVGLIVGDDLIVFDADTPEATVALAQIEEAFDLTPNLTIATSKGVHHYYRRANGTVAKADSHSTADHPERIDVKTGRSMVVLPPSTGKSVEINEAGNGADLTVASQNFIDAIFRHNGRDAPRTRTIRITPSVPRADMDRHCTELNAMTHALDADCGYSEWATVGMILHHETQGSDDGFAIFDAWSATSDKFPGAKEMRAKWDSFGGYDGALVTIATLKTMLKDRGLDWMSICAATEPDFEACETTVIYRDPPPKALPALLGSAIPESFDINNAQPIDATTFPHQKTSVSGNIRLPTTLQNIKHMLDSYGVRVRYNILAKKFDITMPGLSVPPESYDIVALTHIQSLATLNDMATANIPAMVNAIAADHQVNPIADWISSKPWDGKDRLPELFATLVIRGDFPERFRDVLVYRWLLSAVAAALMPTGFHSRGVLILQGPQSIGKTSWFQQLVPNPLLQDATILTAHHLDVTDKDSLVTAIGHWIVEIGEFESTLNRKKDIGRLKGFITNNSDKTRRLYDKGDTPYPRKTVFCASVNDEHFLIDATGNTRWWVIPVDAVDYEHDVDMQQVFAQLKVDFERGERWWLTAEEESELESLNRRHRAVSAIEQQVLDVMDPELPQQQWSRKTPIEILRIAGIKQPANWQCKDCAAVLRDLYGEPRKIQGSLKYHVPIRRFEHPL